ncbi:MAG: protein O-mannosyl-transferase family [Methylococcaceae bacterium]
MKSFKSLNNIVGWITFLIAAVTYLLTIEPTASFWDCGEFITTSFKLEVGHPPGAPFFMIMGRFFSLFGGSPSNAAVMINSMSALASAFTILFLFWTITHLSRKLIKANGELTMGQTIAILGAGMVGALAYTFSDTFWFSAVEGEVYASSSLFTAAVFWAILKWEEQADEPHANRWIILIAYLMGLSIGVHLLNLLAIPALVFVYYYRKYKVTRNGILISLAVSFLILGVIMYVIIPGVVTVATWFELMFVNGMGLPFDTGVIIYALLLVAGLVYGIIYTIRKKLVLWNTVLIGVTVILIGYSSFAMIVIRSAADTPMDQNSPDNVFSLLGYLNREQYGDRPLVFGRYYNTPLVKYEDDKPYYIQKNGKYVIADMRQKPVYDSNLSTIFPRMYSREEGHIEMYKQWANIKGRKVTVAGEDGQSKVIEIPTFGENLAFFINYQVNFMYFRYFMWNFSGRQNDIQSQGEVMNGNWITGINALDAMRLGDQKTLPAEFKNNKGRNAYYMLPFILGIIGIFFMYNQGSEGRKNLWVVFLLFFMTGLAIVLYLNQSPLQPRERDYAYAGSFYAFTIWIGIGVLAIYQLLKKYLAETPSAAIATVLSLVLVPSIMAAENWDDHDRSNRYTARDFGANYLKTCAPNAIIFTNGDNDTFPLWYNQEVEGVRTDVRVCNLSYFQTDWYISQMKAKAYKSEPLPISFTPDQYVQGNRDVVYLMEDPRVKGSVELKKALDFVKDNDPRTKLEQADGASYIPSRKLFVVVDKAAVIKNKVVEPEDYDKIVDTIQIDLSDKHYITKDELMVLDMIATNNWVRPIYFAITIGRDKYMNLQDYFQLEGLAYRLVPIKTAPQGIAFGRVNTKLMYQNVMQDFKWGNMEKPNVYIDENNARMMMNIRNTFDRLAGSLVAEGKNDKATEVLDRCIELIPNRVVPYNYFSLLMSETYFKAGQPEKAKQIINTMVNSYKEQLDYFFRLKGPLRRSVDEDIQRDLYFLREMSQVATRNNQPELLKEVSTVFNSYLDRYSNLK